MALVVTFNSGPKYRRMGRQKIVKGTLAFDASYPTAGEALTAAQLALSRVEHIAVHPFLGFVFGVTYSSATSLLILVYVQGVAIAAAGAAVLDDFALTGVGASTARSVGLDSAATTPVLFGAMKEAASTEDLSSLTAVRFTAYGH